MADGLCLIHQIAKPECVEAHALVGASDGDGGGGKSDVLAEVLREPRSKDASVSGEPNSPVTTRLETPLSSATALQRGVAPV